MADDAVDRAHEMIGALRAAQDRLVALVTSLGPGELMRPSYDDAWTIADVLGHMGSQAEIFGSFLEAGLAGREPPAPDSFPAVWDAWNARSPEQKATDSLAANEAFVARLENLSDTELSGIDLNLFGMEVDAPTLARMRLSEHAAHTWDIAVALDPGARVHPEPVAQLMHTLAQLARYTNKPADRPGRRDLRIHVRTTAPDEEYLLVVGDAVALTPQTGGDGTSASIHLPAEAFLRLIYGRLDAEHTPDAEITADGVDLDDLRAIFPGF
jgi:uncharacterized protein (TIGR03083 family)